jgi:hypothetical protein
MSHDKSSLSVPHLKMLREESGISDLVIELRGYRTITDHRELSALGFASRQLHVPGVQREQHARYGSIPLHVFRPDTPRIEKGSAEER